MFKCIYCNTDIASPSHYKAHLSTNKHKKNYAILTKVNDINQTSIPAITQVQPIQTQNENSNQNKSKFLGKCCNKSFASKFSLGRHYKRCEKVQKIINENTMDIIDNLLGGQIDKSILESKQPINIVINNNITNNNTNNTNNNNSTNNNINNTNNIVQIQTPDEAYAEFWKSHKINPVGFENTDMLKKKEIADRIHRNGLNAFMELIKVVYADSQNHNVALYNKREKLVKYINAKGEVEITTLPKMLDLLVMNNIDVLDKFLDDKDIPIRKTYQSIIEKLKLIHEKDGDNPYFPKYLEALRLILLNISKSALDKITEFETIIANDVVELEKRNGLMVPRTDFRLEPF